jgi:methionyl-tRNA formyltransferase
VNFAFAGTPEFAAWVLYNLTKLGHRPSLVISQPDRPKGRGRRVSPTPTAAEAERLGLECVQTEDINDPALIARMLEGGVSALLVASFGQMLQRPLLEALLCLNVHTSLLPKYRGAAPIERALAAGETQTGVTVMRVTEKLDTGPWALQTALSLSLFDDAASVARGLGVLGAIGAGHVMTGLAEGSVVWTEQTGPSSYAAKLTAKDGLLDPSSGAKALHDRIRAVSPALGARAASGGLEFKVLRSWPYGQPGFPGLPSWAEAVGGKAGRLAVTKERMFIGCAEGAVEALVLQPAGKCRMGTADFLRGYGCRLGDTLEPPVGVFSSSCAEPGEEEVP